MAVGDAVVNIFSGASTFQPAAGVEVCITSCFVQPRTSDDIRITDGVNQGICSNQSGTAQDHLNTKIFITNSIYLYLNAGGAVYSGYSGVQTK